MKIIYHGDGHRGARSMVLKMAGGAFLVAIWVGSLIYDGYQNHLGLIGLLLVGFVAWIAHCAFKFYASVPVNVSILDNGAIRFQSRGDDRTYSADQIRNLAYEYWYEPAGTLIVVALADTWELPCS